MQQNRLPWPWRCGEKGDSPSHLSSFVVGLHPIPWGPLRWKGLCRVAGGEELALAPTGNSLWPGYVLGLATFGQGRSSQRRGQFASRSVEHLYVGHGCQEEWGMSKARIVAPMGLQESRVSAGSHRRTVRRPQLTWGIVCGQGMIWEWQPLESRESFQGTGSVASPWFPSGGVKPVVPHCRAGVHSGAVLQAARWSADGALSLMGDGSPPRRPPPPKDRQRALSPRDR
eukprot:gene15171-biopygen11377